MQTPTQLTSPMPYPEVCAGEPNIKYAKAMLDNIGGSNSEMSAVALYFYNQLVTSHEIEISKVFRDICITEMQHLRIFGMLALQLGENPRFWTYTGQNLVYWTPGYINYPLELSNLLELSIESEREAIQKYEQQARWIADPNVIANIKRILVDERRHVQELTQLYEKYSRR